jgi:hypothetical protein
MLKPYNAYYVAPIMDTLGVTVYSATGSDIWNQSR